MTKDHDALAAAVDLTLELLDVAERTRSFPGPAQEANEFDDENERDKREAIRLERRRYKELRARLLTDEEHGVPVAREFLEAALGVHPSVIPNDDRETEALYEVWLQQQRSSPGGESQ